MSNLNIHNIRHLAKNNSIKWTEHCSLRMFERMVHKSDVKNAILNGSIIEYYPNDYPYPSCLIIGLTNNNNYLHIVCSVSTNYLYIITTYYPNDTYWRDKIERRK